MSNDDVDVGLGTCAACGSPPEVFAVLQRCGECREPLCDDCVASDHDCDESLCATEEDEAT